MKAAAKRGVDVRVLTSGDRCDVPMANVASRYIYKTLLDNGVRIYEYQASTLHAKVVCADSLYSFLGSFNFDMWSYTRNLEVGMGVMNQKLTEQFEKDFMENLDKSKEITKDDVEKASFFVRGIQYVAYLLARI